MVIYTYDVKRRTKIGINQVVAEGSPKSDRNEERTDSVTDNLSDVSSKHQIEMEKIIGTSVVKTWVLPIQELYCGGISKQCYKKVRNHSLRSEYEGPTPSDSTTYARASPSLHPTYS
ncbi:hypothetical protein J6590_067889 [Homalodisca vitripennis]|nr:hypothetical protein J6590_067889 [Homalodisca vitripennis]